MRLCTWTTPDHTPTSRAETKAYVRTHASKCLHNPRLMEKRQHARDWEKANERNLAEANLRQKNARQK